MAAPGSSGWLPRRALAWAMLFALLVSLCLFGRFLQDHDWEWGRERCALLAIFALLVLVARSPAGRLTLSHPLAGALWIAALIALALDARTGIQTLRHAAETGEIRLDQGQNTLRAAREHALYGYKYGPVLPIVTAPVQALIGPAAVPLLQLVFWLGWMVLLALALRAAEVDWGGIALALLAISLEPNVEHNALYLSASDVWVLALMSGAVLAFLRRRPVVLGLCAAAAMACKMLPALLLAPLLFLPLRRQASSFAAVVACLSGLLLLLGPFALWDPLGLWADLVRWPSVMRPDNTHWSFYARDQARLLGRLALSVAVALAALQLVRSRHAGPVLGGPAPPPCSGGSPFTTITRLGSRSGGTARWWPRSSGPTARGPMRPRRARTHSN